MTTWAFIMAAIKALPLVLQLISRFKQAADEKVQRGIGFDLAVKMTLEEGNRKLALADAAEQQARQDHANKPGDDAFDQEFIRKD